MATNINTILSWFKTGLKPNQDQFWASWTSFWHKDEKIPQSNILNLENTLNAKAEKAQLDSHKTDPNAHAELIGGKEDKEQKGMPGGYVPLDEFSKIAHQYLNIINNLESGGASAMLSAEQGVVLQEQIDTINTLLGSDNINLDTVQEIVDAIESLENTAGTVLVNDLATGGATKALTAEMGKVLNEIKLTATLATDAETQITAAVTEDNKVVSRLKLFNWWNWLKTQKQVIAASWDFRGTIRSIPLSGTYPYSNIDNANIGLHLSDTSSVSFGTSTTGSVSYRRAGFQSNVVQNPLSSNRVIYYPDASGTVLLKETFTSLEISQFQKNGTSPMYIRVNNFTSDVLEDLRINVASGNNRPYFERCIVAAAGKGSGTWERCVSTVKIVNTGATQGALAVNTVVNIALSLTSIFTWNIDQLGSRTGAQTSELIAGNGNLKDIDDKTVNVFRIIVELSYAAGAGDGTVTMSMSNPLTTFKVSDTKPINTDSKGAVSYEETFTLAAVKTSDNNAGYSLSMSVGSKELTGWRIKNIVRTNN